MKGLLIFALVVVLAFAGKPFNDLYHHLDDIEEFELQDATDNGPIDDQVTPSAYSTQRPTKSSTREPYTGDFKPTGTTKPYTWDFKQTGTRKPYTGDFKPTGTPFFTGQPKTDEFGTEEPSTGRPKSGIFGRFLHFLMVKSVRGVKPDEHPDLKYQKPGSDLVDELFKVREAVLGTVRPFKEILRLMKEDYIEMMRRVHEAVQEQNIAKATHIVGEYFIAIQRRIAMLVIHAAQKGLLDNAEKADVDMEDMQRELREHSEKAHEAAKFILENFNEYRVSDGLRDAPFVRLSVVTSQVMEEAKKQVENVIEVCSHVYVDMISQVVSLSMDHHNHEAAVHRAGAGVLSFMRRGTKAETVLNYIREAKQCRRRDERRDWNVMS